MTAIKIIKYYCNINRSSFANVPIMSHALQASTAHTKTIQVVVTAN